MERDLPCSKQERRRFIHITPTLCWATNQGRKHLYGQLPGTCCCNQTSWLVSHNQHTGHLSHKFHHRAAGPRHSPRFKNLTSPSGVARMFLELLSTALLLWHQHRAARRSQIMSCAFLKKGNSSMSFTPLAAWSTSCKPRLLKTMTVLPNSPRPAQLESFWVTNSPWGEMASRIHCR